MGKHRVQHGNDLHHRKPRSLGDPKCCKMNDPENVSEVLVSKHRAWHLLFKNYTPERIIQIINAVWIDPDYIIIAKRKDQ